MQVTVLGVALMVLILLVTRIYLQGTFHCRGRGRGRTSRRANL